MRYLFTVTYTDDDGTFHTLEFRSAKSAGQVFDCLRAVGYNPNCFYTTKKQSCSLPAREPHECGERGPWTTKVTI